jgi:DNA adenine methylase
MPAAARSEVPQPALKSPLKPPLKWAGGKRWQVPHLQRLWERHSHRRLVEPFCGGLAVSLGLLPSRALLNDANPHLINFYQWLQKGLRGDVLMENDEDLFYKHRSRFNSLLAAGKGTSREAALLFYYLNRTGYNGLCRFNRSGEFNVPIGRYKRISYMREQDFTRYRDLLASWTFTSQDVEEVPLGRRDFVYADPPYDVEFTHYSKGGFSWEDQERTAVHFSKHPGPVVLVNQATPRIEALYLQLRYNVDFLKAPRRISCNGDRSPAREIIATRNL